MELRDYQVSIAERACELLRNFKIAILCMEMRTGKTLTSLYAASLYGANRVLFVSKKKALRSIADDFEKLGKPYEFAIINYEMLHTVTNNFDLIILDESHSLGQFPKPSLRTKRLKEICKDTPIIYLSGTPTPEGYSQLYHQMWVSSYSPWRQYQSFYKWFNFYGVAKKRLIYGRDVNDYRTTKIDMVLADVNKFIIAFTQKEAGFETEVEDIIITIPMPDIIKKAITTIRRDKFIKTSDNRLITADTVVKEMGKVHQLCGGTIKCDNDECLLIDSTKAEYVNNNFVGKRIAIFYKYVGEASILIKTFGDKITTDSYEFNNSNDKIFISQFQSGREGVNLSTADCIIMFNIDFSAVSYWQSRARLMLKDRDREAKIYWLFFEGGIEPKIYESVKNKKTFTTYIYKKNKNYGSN